MKLTRIALFLIILWLGATALSVLAPIIIEPTGDGFTRGINRLYAIVGWQAVATLVAAFAWIFAKLKLEGHPAWKRWTCRPLFVQLALFLLAALGIAYLSVSSRPGAEPQPTSPTKPIAETGAGAPEEFEQVPQSIRKREP